MKKALKSLPLLILIFLTFTAFTAQGANAKGSILLTVKNVSEGVSLSWKGSNNTSYSVFKKTGNGKFIKITSVKGKKYTDKDVISGKKYSYCVRKSKEIKSSHISVTYLDVPKITKAKNTNEGISLTWKGVNGAAKYAIYRKTADGKRIKLGSTKAITFTDTTAERDVKYCYTVKAYKNGSFSAAEGVSALNPASPEITAVKRHNGSLGVNWEKTANAKKYIIYRKLSSKVKWEKIATVSSAKASYKDKSVESGKKYSYYVAAASGKYESAYPGTHIDRTYISPPTAFTLSQNLKKVTLTWKKVDDATKYELYKKVGSGKWEKDREILPGKESCTVTVSSSAEKISFKIRTVISTGSSAFSKALTAKYIDPNKPMVALTYDDGPHPTHTDTILDVLEKYGARATFFVVGSRITAYSDCLKRQNSLGCEIGNHSYSHASLSSNPDKTVIKEISQTDKLIKKYSGQTCTVARAPGGSVGKAKKLIDKPFIHWSVDTRDWESRSCSKIVSHIKSTVRDGSIILMHDLYGSTAEATKQIVPWLIKKGYQLVTVSEMMEARGTKMTGGKIYYNGY